MEAADATGKEISNKKEVIENPTLKTLSGSLNRWSLYTTFVYYGGSLETPTSAERPNILKAAETPSLVNMAGNMGFKYRLTEQDNLSLQIGLYSTAPFHSKFESDNPKIQADFDKNGQSVDVDDPVMSYFRTYTVGKLQNISFLKYQHVTRGSFRDFGLDSLLSYSHAAAYKIAPFAYIAASLTYENYQYDKNSTTLKGRRISLASYQTEHTFRGNLSTEFYVTKSISFRLISDIFSYFQMRTETNFEKRGLQQTVAMTYFFNRDISISPNTRFIAEDIRLDRTNLGLTLNLNL